MTDAFIPFSFLTLVIHFFFHSSYLSLDRKYMLHFFYFLLKYTVLSEILPLPKFSSSESF